MIDDIETQGIDKTYCLGDLVGYGPSPNQVIDTIRRVGFPTVMGNYDEGVGFERGDCRCAYVTDEEKANGRKSIYWTTKMVTPDNKEFLRNLLNEVKFTVDGYRFLLIHGSPRRNNEYLYEDRSEDSLMRIIKPLDIEIMVCGHTHKQDHRQVSGIHIINEGSVGKPKDGDPRACYVVIDTEESLSVEFRRIKYPIEEVAEHIIDTGLPREFAEALRTGGK